jgi:hypothetical protein
MIAMAEVKTRREAFSFILALFQVLKRQQVSTIDQSSVVHKVDSHWPLKKYALAAGGKKAICCVSFLQLKDMQNRHTKVQACRMHSNVRETTSIDLTSPRNV